MIIYGYLIEKPTDFCIRIANKPDPPHRKMTCKQKNIFRYKIDGNDIIIDLRLSKIEWSQSKFYIEKFFTDKFKTWGGLSGKGIL